ncbi:MAG: radical SAM protein [Gammaproteobacteria bacterium]|nr:radical SAM protein [Gammaproteobacteria bacterium]
MNDKDFNIKYGSLFDQQFKLAKDYVQNPSMLLEEVGKKLAQRDASRLYMPQADEYNQKLTYYRGFLRFPERLKNYILFQSEPKKIDQEYKPYIMDIEPNSRCNFRCTMCQVSEWDHGSRADDMSLKDFQDFIDTQPQLMEVKLHGMGEPLMHRRYIDMVKYLASLDIWVRTTINGSLLHVRDNYKKIIDSGIGEIQTSFDGACKETFEKIRRNSNFETVVKNLTMLNEYANTKDRYYTRMWVLLQKANRHELFDFVTLAKKMKFKRMSYSITLNDWGQDTWAKKNMENETDGLTEEEKNKLLELSKKEDIDITVWYQSNKYSSKRLDTTCPWPFERPYISSDLRIVPCSMIGNPEVSDFGSAKELNAIWNSSIYREFREAHIQGKIPNICKLCYKKEEIK